MNLQQIRDLHWEWHDYLEKLEAMPESPEVCRNIEIAHRNIARLKARAREINTINAVWIRAMQS